jgi:hypothetical protein
MHRVADVWGICANENPSNLGNPVLSFAYEPFYPIIILSVSCFWPDNTPVGFGISFGRKLPTELKRHHWSLLNIVTYQFPIYRKIDLNI